MSGLVSTLIWLIVILVLLYVLFLIVNSFRR